MIYVKSIKDLNHRNSNAHVFQGATSLPVKLLPKLRKPTMILPYLFQKTCQTCHISQCILMISAQGSLSALKRADVDFFGANLILTAFLQKHPLVFQNI